MSANAASLSCPVCAHNSAFNSVESLRDRLICVSTKKILCPVCQEEVNGLDKLTIHLFSHVKITNFKENSSPCTDTESSLKPNESLVKSQCKKSRAAPSSSKNKSQSTAPSPVKFVKIYPKLPVISLSPVPIIDISQGKSKNESCIQVKNSIYVSNVKADESFVPNNLCKICGLQFVDENILKMHKCLIHNIDENSNSNFTRYNCHLCTKNFKMRGSLMVHMRVAHLGFSAASNKINENTEKLSTGQDKDHNDNNPPIPERCDAKQWQCEVCKKCFTTKYFLKKHKRLHTGETPYSCSQCNKTFTFQQSYHKHLLYHNDDKPHTCTFCGRAFKELSTLHNHQRIHTGEKPFSCETCGKCFRQRVSYLVHRRIHTGVMPYKCTACDKSFRYKVSQRTHKCLAQPPGIVIKQNCSNLVEKLKKKHLDNKTDCLKSPKNQTNDEVFDSKAYGFPEVSEANAELARKGAKLSLEDMESENFNLIADTILENTNDILPNSSQSVCLTHTEKDPLFKSNVDELMNSIAVEDTGVPSPSEILKNLCLSTEDDVLNWNTSNNY